MMIRFNLILTVLALGGCACQQQADKPVAAAAVMKQQINRITSFEVRGTVRHDEAGKIAEVEFAAEVQGTAKNAGIALQNILPMLRASGVTLVASSGTNGQIQGDDVETYTVGKSTMGLGKASETRYVVIHFEGSQDLTMKILTTNTAGTTKPLPPGAMCEVKQDGAGNWQFGTPGPVNLSDPTAKALDDLRKTL